MSFMSNMKFMTTPHVSHVKFAFPYHTPCQSCQMWLSGQHFLLVMPNLTASSPSSPSSSPKSPSSLDCYRFPDVLHYQMKQGPTFDHNTCKPCRNQLFWPRYIPVMRKPMDLPWHMPAMMKPKLLTMTHARHAETNILTTTLLALYIWLSLSFSHVADGLRTIQFLFYLIRSQTKG